LDDTHTDGSVKGFEMRERAEDGKLSLVVEEGAVVGKMKEQTTGGWREE
jgi:hypothetical protein